MITIKWAVLGLILALCIYAPIMLINRELAKTDIKIDELEVRAEKFRTDIEIQTIQLMVLQPIRYFEPIEASDQWELIEAVPYSKCYRHKTGASNSVSDFIVCKAI